MAAVAQFASIGLTILKTEAITSQESIPAMLTRWGLASQTQECFWVIAYDPMMKLRSVVEIARGGYAKVGVHFPAVFTAVLAVGADRFMVAHNHPAGPPKPTKMDIDLTIGLMAGANALGLFFEDHWIVTPGGRTYSFAKTGLLVPAEYDGSVRSASS